MSSELRIVQDDPESADSVALIAALSAELGERYGDDGGGMFKPEDVRVPRAAFFVARVGDAAVGCGALRPMPDDDAVGEIKRMFVDKAWRGISRAVLETIEAFAREHQYARLKLETGLRQPEAMGLYAKAGYTSIECWGAYADDPLSVCYEKRL